MKIWRRDGNGKSYAVDYTIGENPVMKYATLTPPKNVASLEGWIISELAKVHQIADSKVFPYQIVQTGE
jgi:hypothetical protein